MTDEQENKGSLRGRGHDIMRGPSDSSANASGGWLPSASEEGEGEPYFDDDQAVLKWMEVDPEQNRPTVIPNKKLVDQPRVDTGLLYPDPDFDAIFGSEEAEDETVVQAPPSTSQPLVMTPPEPVSVSQPAQGLENLFTEAPPFDDLFGELTEPALPLPQTDELFGDVQEVVYEEEPSPVEEASDIYATQFELEQLEAPPPARASDAYETLTETEWDNLEAVLPTEEEYAVEDERETQFGMPTIKLNERSLPDELTSQLAYENLPSLEALQPETDLPLNEQNLPDEMTLPVDYEELPPAEAMQPESDLLLNDQNLPDEMTLPLDYEELPTIENWMAESEDDFAETRALEQVLADIIPEEEAADNAPDWVDSGLATMEIEMPAPPEALLRAEAIPPDQEDEIPTETSLSAEELGLEELTDAEEAPRIEDEFVTEVHDLDEFIADYMEEPEEQHSTDAYRPIDLAQEPTEADMEELLEAVGGDEFPLEDNEMEDATAILNEQFDDPRKVSTAHLPALSLLQEVSSEIPLEEYIHSDWEDEPEPLEESEYGDMSEAEAFISLLEREADEPVAPLAAQLPTDSPGYLPFDEAIPLTEAITRPVDLRSAVVSHRAIDKLIPGEPEVLPGGQGLEESFANIPQEPVEEVPEAVIPTSPPPLEASMALANASEPTPPPRQGALVQPSGLTPDRELLGMFVDDNRLRELFEQIEALQEEVVQSVHGASRSSDIYLEELLYASNLLLSSRDNYDEARATVYRVRANLHREQRIVSQTEFERPRLLMIYAVLPIIIATLFLLSGLFEGLAESLGIGWLGQGYLAAIAGLLGAWVVGVVTLWRRNTVQEWLDNPIDLRWYVLNPFLGATVGYLIYLFLAAATWGSGSTEAIGDSPVTLITALIGGATQDSILKVIFAARQRIAPTTMEETGIARHRQG